MYQRKLHQALALATALALSACGGGSGDSSSASSSSVGDVNNRTISGMVATGAALSNSSVTISCSSDNTLSTDSTTTTNQKGEFSYTLSTGQSYPCFINANYTRTFSTGYESVYLKSIAYGGGHLNVTPVTDLISARAGVELMALNRVLPKAAELVEPTNTILVQIHKLTSRRYEGDPFTSTLVVGDNNDKVLDEIQRVIQTGKVSWYSDLTDAAEKKDDIGEFAKRGDGRGNSYAAPTLIKAWSQQEAAALIATLQGKGFTGLAAAQCGVSAYQLNYNTSGPRGEVTNATGVMLVPTGSGKCSSPSPLMGYARGTEFSHDRTLARLSSANDMDPETAALAAMYASQGITVVATDYLGYAGSTFPYHPYLHADSEASTVIDSLRAARLAAYQTGANLSNQILLAGYSQGGHASMATQRAIESDNPTEFNIVAASHMAGPYNLSGAMNTVISGSPGFALFAITAWNKVYGTIPTTDVFNTSYVNYIGDLLPYTAGNKSNFDTVNNMINANPSVAVSNLLRPDFYNALIGGSRSGAAGAFATAATMNSFINAIWTPKSNMQLCGGKDDPVVPPSIHLNLFKSQFPSAKNITSIDVDSDVKALAAARSDTDISAADYHGTYEPVACHLKTQAYFTTQLAASR